MAHNFESISTSIVKQVTITPLRKIEGTSVLRKAWKSVVNPLIPDPTRAAGEDSANGLAQWERELLGATTEATWQGEATSELAAGARAPIATFTRMEEWLTENGYALVKVEG